jgi:hypothetical protein
MASDRKITQGEQEFIDQYTRYLMAQAWCPKAVAGGGLVSVNIAQHEPYLRYAQSKKWLTSAKEKDSLAEMVAVLSNGWKTAARFLKR